MSTHVILKLLDQVLFRRGDWDALLHDLAADGCAVKMIWQYVGLWATKHYDFRKMAHYEVSSPFIRR